MVCMTMWHCQKCGKAMSLQKTAEQGFWVSVFENEDGSPRALRDDTQARVIAVDHPGSDLFSEMICWDCSQNNCLLTK